MLRTCLSVQDYFLLEFVSDVLKAPRLLPVEGVQLFNEVFVLLFRNERGLFGVKLRLQGG